VDPLVSIITPAYNASYTLPRAMESVRSQTYSRWQHIIVDDGSTDATPRLLDEYQTDQRVLRTQISNSGIGRALNAGLALSAGEFVAFLDADDEYLQDHLGAHLAFFDEHPSVDLTWGGLEVIAERYEDTLVPDVERGSGLIPVTECVVQGTLFFRREIVNHFQFSEDRKVWSQDSEFVKRVSQERTVERFKETTYRYYRNSGNSMIDGIKAHWGY
jgi:glycosyltransferase involved in cell wall biosynthesis